MGKKELRLRRFGENFYGQMVYQDVDTGRYYVSLRDIDPNEPTLYTVSPSDDPDGEPENPYDGDYTIVNPMTDREKREELHVFDYMMCSRISQDIRAFLHGGPEDCRCKNERMLGQSIRSLMEELKKYWARIPADLKPQWLTQDEIDSWEKEI